MYKYRFLQAVVCLATLLSACDNKRIVSPDELRKYIQNTDNGLIQNKSINEIDIEIVYRPKELVLAQQLDGVGDETERDKIKKQLDSLDYFIIHLSHNGHEIENDYASNPLGLSAITNYFSSGILSDLSINNNGEKITPLDIVYTPMYGASQATSMMVIFKSSIQDRTGDLNLSLHDSMLGTGVSAFIFRTHDIQNIPTLNLD